MKRKVEEVVKDLITQYIDRKPRMVSLKLSWHDDLSEITISGENLEKKVKYPFTIPFTSFAQGVIEAYEEVYGKLRVIPVSFREEIYENEKVSLDLYPTGGAGVFEVWVTYKEDRRRGE